MIVSRRNLLIGLGVSAAGGGALLGTGAFTTVSAERSVSVQTAGDGQAFLTIVPGENGSHYIQDDGSGTVQIDITGAGGTDGFNERSKTTITKLLKVTNNAADGSDATVGLSGSAPTATPTAEATTAFTVQDGDGNAVADLTFFVGDSLDNASVATLSVGGASASIGVLVDTYDVGTENGTTLPVDDTLTIVAVEPQNGGDGSGGGNTGQTRTFDLAWIDPQYGTGTVEVTDGTATFDTSSLTEPASTWGGTNNKVGFWFGDGSRSTDLNDKVEVEYLNSSWGLKNNDLGAGLGEFTTDLTGDTFTVEFDPATYPEFGLYVKQMDSSNDNRAAVATPNDTRPWSGVLYDLQ
jgi:hypothetical protein